MLQVYKTSLPTIEELEDELSKDIKALEQTTAKLQSLTNLLAKERELLHELAEKNATLAAELVALHYATYALAYQKEKIADASSTALEELENIVKICGGYAKLGLTPV